MIEPSFHGKRPVFSASAAVEALGRAIGEIKSADRLTWSDVGHVLGVSEDQAAKYADGSATMNAVAYARGKREWNGRFTGYLDRLCVDSRPGGGTDRHDQCNLLKAALALSVALEDDDAITREEVRKNRSTLEAARDAIDHQLRKLVIAA